MNQPWPFLEARFCVLWQLSCKASGPCSVPVAMLNTFFLHGLKKHAQSRSLRNVYTPKPELKVDGSFQIFSPSLQTAAALCSLCVQFTVPDHTLSLQNAAQSSV